MALKTNRPLQQALITAQHLHDFASLLTLLTLLSLLSLSLPLSLLLTADGPPEEAARNRVISMNGRLKSIRVFAEKKRSAGDRDCESRRRIERRIQPVSQSGEKQR